MSKFKPLLSLAANCLLQVFRTFFFLNRTLCLQCTQREASRSIYHIAPKVSPHPHFKKKLWWRGLLVWNLNVQKNEIKKETAVTSWCSITPNSQYILWLQPDLFNLWATAGPVCLNLRSAALKFPRLRSYQGWYSNLLTPVGFLIRSDSPHKRAAVVVLFSSSTLLIVLASLIGMNISVDAVEHRK